MTHMSRNFKKKKKFRDSQDTPRMYISVYAKFQVHRNDSFCAYSVYTHRPQTDNQGRGAPNPMWILVIPDRWTLIDLYAVCGYYCGHAISLSEYRNTRAPLNCAPTPLPSRWPSSGLASGLVFTASRFESHFLLCICTGLEDIIVEFQQRVQGIPVCFVTVAGVSPLRILICNTLEIIRNGPMLLHMATLCPFVIKLVFL